MARSLIKRRQEAERERLDAYQATLRRVSRAERPAPDSTRLKEAKKGFEGESRDCALAPNSRPATPPLGFPARHLFPFPCPRISKPLLESRG